MRARDLGVQIGTGAPGPRNSITDVGEVRVGHATIVRGEGPLVRGVGPVRTGVTIIDPGGDIWTRPMFAGAHVLNGCGEVTGLSWLRESGSLGSPIGLTNTHSVGVVHEGLIRHRIEGEADVSGFAGLPVVGETNDAKLNDTSGFHVTPETVVEALDDLDQDVAEGSVGSGTGMVCHGFKGGIGTASRQVRVGERTYTIGVLIQSNHGARNRLTVNGVLVGPSMTPPAAGSDAKREGDGSFILVVATDAPLLPGQCDRLAQRAVLGVGRTGGAGEFSSGDFAVAFSTANQIYSVQGLIEPPQEPFSISVLSDAALNPIYWAAIEATEEAIVNSIVAARTMTGRDGIVVHAMPHDELVELLERHDALSTASS
ncbi:S58 family peptidase [Streptomyces sp. SID8361]|uniref:DmpA family aminopeptidase n=1 Tax=Streptomyces sp. MnatMP-M27 TaxID=1839768 RepID=UPI00081D6C7A|nr:P1 family peptidase [Streptomyces sp. MnatMP-M27]MYU10059.1 S58 family peptidase [Streptomyces sp. SID8361]SCF67939.1 L-aminopeptidase DmpA. Serine peptidase. MEROPS family S58 [Streptomyces sp. MnatMP-M27]